MDPSGLTQGSTNLLSKKQKKKKKKKISFANKYLF